MYLQGNIFHETNLTLQECARILLTPPQRQQFLKEIRRPNLSSVQRDAITRKVTELCRKARRCPYCTQINGPVKKFAALRIIHEKYKSIGTSKDLVLQKSQFEKSFEYAATVANDLKRNIPRAIDNIDPQTALRLFQMISPQVEILSLFLC
jgi:DNA-directed RNA polymerase III subunit RPC1